MPSISPPPPMDISHVSELAIPKSFHPTMRAVPRFLAESVKVEFDRLITGHMLSHTAGSQRSGGAVASDQEGQP